MTRSPRRASRPALARLGLRLAGGSGVPVRAVSVVVATAVAAFLLVTAVGIANAETAFTGGWSRVSPESRNLILSVSLALALPTLMLVATVSRLSARLRERRLASLRLLGLGPGETRWVAAWESGGTALVGSLLGAVAAMALGGTIEQWDPARRGWLIDSLTAPPPAVVALVLALPVVAVLTSLAPTRKSTEQLFAQVRSSETRRPSWLRCAPLAMGSALLAACVLTGTDDSDWIMAFFAGTTLAGLGLALTVPVLVRLVADALVRAGAPTATLAGRRLQAMPGGTARIVATLLLGLFVVTGARYVVAAFEDVSASAIAAAEGPTQRLDLFVGAKADPNRVASVLAASPSVRETSMARTLTTRCRHDRDYCGEALVTTCAALPVLLGVGVEGCRDEGVGWCCAGSPSPGGVVVSPTGMRAHRLAVSLPPPSFQMTYTAGGEFSTFLFVPSGWRPDVDAAATRASQRWAVTAEPGFDIPHELVGDLREAGVDGAGLQSAADESDYRFIVALRLLVWSVAAVVLSIGLLAFALAAIDRVSERRRELASVQVIGTPRRVLRASQLVEALLPLAVGVPLAVGLGALAGQSFLALGGGEEWAPVRPVLRLLVLSSLAGIVVAGLTTIGSSPPLTANRLRRE